MKHRNNLKKDLNTRKKLQKYMFEENPQPMWIYDLNTLDFLDVNEAAITKYGYSRDEFLNMTLKDIRPEEDISNLMHSIETTFSDYHQAGNCRHRKKNGEIIDVEITSHYTEYNNKPARHVLINDISEIKKAESKLSHLASNAKDLLPAAEALRESEERFRIALKSSPIVVFQQDPDLRYTWIHNSHPGFIPETVLGKTDEQLLPTEDAARMTELKQSVLDTGKGKRAVVRTTIGGTPFYYDLTVEPLFDARGNLKGITCASLDITERKLTEENLLASETRYRRLFESAKEGILILDADTGMIVDVNPFLIKLLGYTITEFHRKKIWEVGFFKDVIANKAYLLELQQKGYIRHEDMPLETSDGLTIYVEFISNVYLVNHQKVIQCNIRDISEQKQAEEKLRESESRYRKIYEDGANGMVMVGKDFKFIMANRTFCQLVGYREEELQQLTFVDITHPDDSTKDIPHVKKMIAGEIDVYRTEKRFINKNGQTIWAQLTISPFYDSKGQFLYNLAIIVNITERKKAEMQLVESESLLSRSQEIAHIGSWKLDLTSNNLYWSDEVYRIFGCKPQEFTATYEAFLDFIHPDDRMAVDAAYSGSLREGTDSYEIEHRIVRQGTGEIRHVHERCVHVRDDAGVIIQSIGMVQDITERKQSEEKLKLLNRAIEASSVAVEITDAEGNINYVNPFFTELTGYSYQEVLGKNPRFLKSGNHPKTFYEKLWNTILSGREWTGEFQNKKKNGELYWEKAVISPILNSKGAITHFVAIKNDITEKKKAEREIIELNQELEKRVESRTAQLTEVNKELEAFTYSVSHDLRGPLRAINGFAEILVEDYADLLPEEAKRTCFVIRNNAIKMGKLINELLKLSRLSKQEMLFTNIDMNVLADTVFEEVTTIEQKNRILFNRGNLENCYGDGTLIKQVLVNLISNAVKYTGKTEKPVIEIKSEVSDGNIIYTISDNGAGFDMNYADKLFTVFQRLHSEKEFDGTGVGLAIVHRIINRHEGKVWANGTEGKGAEFYFSLPKCQ
jgi:PAS domain S-box-containing protein